MTSAGRSRGALGVAVVGSITSTTYQSRVDGKLPPLPAPLHDAAAGSIGAAHAVAAHLPPAAHTALVNAASSAFTDALGIGLGCAALVSATAAVLVARRLPAHHLDEDRAPSRVPDAEPVTA